MIWVFFGTVSLQVIIWIPKTRSEFAYTCLQIVFDLFINQHFGCETRLLITIYIIEFGTANGLSRNRSWHRICPRQTIIPDHKLKKWYLAVNSLQHEVARDFLLFLLLTGMRFGEARKLKWCHIDFKNRVAILPRENTKSDREHRLPLGDFLVELLRKRYVHRRNSEWVFQSIRLKNKPLSGGVGIVRGVRAKSGIRFSFHDLRRTFLTMGEKLDLPVYVLKRLVNHSISKDVTGGYLVLDIERLRIHMSRIEKSFLELIGYNDNALGEWKCGKHSVAEEVTQLQILINDVGIL